MEIKCKAYFTCITVKDGLYHTIIYKFIEQTKSMLLQAWVMEFMQGLSLTFDTIIIGQKNLLSFNKLNNIKQPISDLKFTLNNLSILQQSDRALVRNVYITFTPEFQHFQQCSDWNFYITQTSLKTIITLSEYEKITFIHTKN